MRTSLRPNGAMDETKVPPAATPDSEQPPSIAAFDDDKGLPSTTEHVEALKAGGRGDVQPPTTFTLDEERRIIRLLDWHIMPWIFVLYSLSVLDRSNLGNARIAGMEDDINLEGKRYDWLATVFYIAYILSQWTQLGWKAFKPHNWVAFTVFVSRNRAFKPFGEI